MNDHPQLNVLTFASTNPKPRVLIHGLVPTTPEADAALHDLADVYSFGPCSYADAPAELAKAVEAHGPFIAFGGIYRPTAPFPFGPWNGDFLGPLMPDCRIITGPGAGYDKIDMEYLSRNGVVYANCPIEVGKRTADAALTLLLSSMHGVVPMTHTIREGGFRDPMFKGRMWRGSTVGIIGLGNIGTQVAAMCAALGMKVIYNNRRKKEVPYDWVSLDELYARSDAVVVTAPLTDETQGLLSSGAFEKMKDGVVVVNVGRGPIINEEALVEALESGKVLRAGLDVFENEPDVHPGLRSSPSVTMTPHWAVNPDVRIEEMWAETIWQIVEFLRTGTPASPINAKEAGLAMKVNGHS